MSLLGMTLTCSEIKSAIYFTAAKEKKIDANVRDVNVRLHRVGRKGAGLLQRKCTDFIENIRRFKILDFFSLELMFIFEAFGSNVMEAFLVN